MIDGTDFEAWCKRHAKRHGREFTAEEKDLAMDAYFASAQLIARRVRQLRRERDAAQANPAGGDHA